MGDLVVLVVDVADNTFSTLILADDVALRGIQWACTRLSVNPILLLTLYSRC